MKGPAMRIIRRGARAIAAAPSAVLLATHAAWIRSRVLGSVVFLVSVPALPAQVPAREDGQWTMPGKDYAATRYSGLAQINPANAARLRPVWTFSTGVLRGHEGQPLVVGHTLYVVTPYPNVLYAFDLSQPGYPLQWKYR